MIDSRKQQRFLQLLPGVDRVLEWMKTDPLGRNTPKSLLVRSIRMIIADRRASILADDGRITEDRLSEASLCEAVRGQVEKSSAPRLISTINATGVVVHTNLGRSLLTDTAVENIRAIGGRHSNLEFDLSTGKRGSRHDSVADILCELSGAEAALAVNNNAGAVLLCLDTIARDKKVIVSRGELVEIGGSFRIPDVMAKSGGILREVGTTNRTHLRDYEGAIENDTGLLLKVHTSNYSIVGFTLDVSLEQLVTLGNKYEMPVMEDLGSGTFIDFSCYGLRKEPTVQDAVATGADIVSFSGDKLLGGPQAGIILGKKEILESIKKNPLARALRIDKLTLAALESTLRLYRDPEDAVATIPTLRMLTMPVSRIEYKADQLAEQLIALKDSRLSAKRMPLYSRAGGGSLPQLKLPTHGVGVTIQNMSANAIERYMRGHSPPIIGRIEHGTFIMDLRTLEDDELAVVVDAFSFILKSVA